MSRYGQGQQPPWDPTLFPNQGEWSEEEYLSLNTNRLVEFTDGYLEVLPPPTELHQSIVLFLVNTLRGFIKPRNLGTALMAPLRVKLRKNKMREPDVLFLLTANSSKRGDDFWTGADLVMEVVSEDDPARDYSTKRQDYAEAGIAEYWIVDPQEREVIILKLADDEYETHGVFKAGQEASSRLLQGFSLSVNAILNAAVAD